MESPTRLKSTIGLVTQRRASRVEISPTRRPSLKPDQNFQMTDVYIPMASQIYSRRKSAHINLPRNLTQRMNTIVSRGMPQSSLSQIQSIEHTEGASTVKKTVVSSQTFAVKSRRILEAPEGEFEVNLEKVNREEKKLLISKFIEEPHNRGKLRTAVSRYCVLSTSNLLYQAWKLLMIVASFFAALAYAYFMAIFNQMTEEQSAFYRLFDEAATLAFLIDMILQFFVELHLDHGIERDIINIWVHYLKSDFLFDLITVVPFLDLMPNEWKHRELVLLLKVIRLRLGFQLLDISVMMREIKETQQKRLKALLQTSRSKAHSQLIDQTRISQIVKLKYFMQAVQLVLVLICLSFLSGMLWWEFCLIEEQDFAQESFLTHNNLHERPNAEVAIVMSYFMFTTLSTVGLGDFHPTNSAERVFGTFILLFGVLITSYVMDQFSDMLVQFTALDKEHEESAQLSVFITVLKKYNENRALKASFVAEVEKYFNYRWSCERNRVIATQKEREMLAELPKQVQFSIYIDFLYKGLFSIYKDVLAFDSRALATEQKSVHLKMRVWVEEKWSRNLVDRFNTYYSESSRYQLLLCLILQNLEPLSLPENKMIFGPDLQDIEFALFITNGRIGVGYSSDSAAEVSSSEDSGSGSESVNGFSSLSSSASIRQKKLTFPITLYPGHYIVGLFESIFDKKMPFYYKTRPLRRVRDYYQDRQLHCFFIRKHNLKSVLESCEDPTPEIPEGFRLRTLMNFISRILLPIRHHKTQSQMKGSRKMKRQATVKSIENEWKKEKRAIRRMQAHQLAKILKDRVVRQYTDKLNCSQLDFKMLGQGNLQEPLPEVVVHTINKKSSFSNVDQQSTEDAATLDRIDGFSLDLRAKIHELVGELAEAKMTIHKQREELNFIRLQMEKQQEAISSYQRELERTSMTKSLKSLFSSLDTPTPQTTIQRQPLRMDIDLDDELLSTSDIDVQIASPLLNSEIPRSKSPLPGDLPQIKLKHLSSLGSFKKVAKFKTFRQELFTILEEDHHIENKPVMPSKTIIGDGNDNGMRNNTHTSKKLTHFSFAHSIDKAHAALGAMRLSYDPKMHETPQTLGPELNGRESQAGPQDTAQLQLKPQPRSSLDNVKPAIKGESTFSIQEEIQVEEEGQAEEAAFVEDTLDHEEETILEEINIVESPPGNIQSSIPEEIPIESDFNLTIGPIQTPMMDESILEDIIMDNYPDDEF